MRSSNALLWESECVSMRTLPAVLALGLGLASPACAEQLDTQQVAADARWFVHIDVDAIKAGQVPQTLGSLVLKSPASSRELQRVAEIAGLDLPEDLLLKAMRATKIETKTKVITIALKELIRKRTIAGLKEFKGKVKMDVDMDKLRGR